MRLNGRESKTLVEVGAYQGLVLSPLLFNIVSEALSKKFKKGLSMELIYMQMILFWLQ